MEEEDDKRLQKQTITESAINQSSLWLTSKLCLTVLPTYNDIDFKSFQSNFPKVFNQFDQSKMEVVTKVFFFIFRAGGAMVKNLNHAISPAQSGFNVIM